MTRVAGFIDGEACAVALLKAASTIAGDKVGTRLVEGFEDDLPRLRCWRVGGGVDDLAIIDRARVQIDCWAADKSDAWELAVEAVQALADVSGVSPVQHQDDADGLLVSEWVSHIGVETSPTWTDDPDRPDLGRYWFTVAITGRRTETAPP